MAAFIANLPAAWRDRILAYGPAAAAILLTALVCTIVFSRLDVLVGDIYQNELGQFEAAKTDIVIVDLTEEALAKLPYRSPIDRGFLADLIRHIDSCKPAAIAIDILFDQPSEPAKDRRLAEALAGVRAPLVLAHADRGDALTARQAEHLEGILAETEKSRANNRQSLKPSTKPGGGQPYRFARGRVTLSRDTADGAIRYWPQAQPSYGPRHDADDGHADVAGDGSAPDFFSLAIAGLVADGPRAGQGRIVFYDPPQNAGADQPEGNHGPFTSYPAHLAKLVPKDWLKNKIVLIGSTQQNVDEHRTTLLTSRGVSEGMLYGITIHAHMLHQLLQRERIATASPIMNFLLALAVSIAAAYAVSQLSLPLYARLLIAGCIAILPAILSLAAFLSVRFDVAAASPVLAGLLTTAIFATRQWYLDNAQRRFVQTAFARYVSPRIVERLVADPSRLKLGGETRHVTYVFTDIAGFTGLSERLEPDDVSALLNAYLDGVCDVFIAHGATIDKIIGDAVVGLLGAPDDQPDQADRAIALALGVDEFCEAFRESDLIRSLLAGKNADIGATRIGINSGPAVVGNFGGARFFDYTGIGDTVNTAARLEAANKYFGTRVCVSESTAKACKSHQFRPIGDIILKGKAVAVRCFEPCSGGDSRQPTTAAYITAYEKLKAGDGTAIDDFQAIVNSGANDPLASFHLNRLRTGETGTTITLSDK